MAKKQFDFSKVEILSLDGQRINTEQLRTEVCNILYMQGEDIVEHELGQRLWHAVDGDGQPVAIEISEKEEEYLRKRFAKYPYLIRTALLKQLNV